MGRVFVRALTFSSAVLSRSCTDALRDQDQQEQWLGGHSQRRTAGCLAITEVTGCGSEATLQPRLLRRRTRSNSTGTNDLSSTANADLIIVAAAQSAGIGLFVLRRPGGRDGLRSLLETMDPTRKMGDIALHNVVATRLNASPADALNTLLDVACIALANEMIGGAQRLLNAAVDYTQLRYQFGRSIASFQAIKHRLADLLLEVELARSAAYQAAQTLADCGDLRTLSSSQQRLLTEHASLAKAMVSETYLQAALETIQLHGGIGFTWENDTHLWFKRAKSSEVLFGTPAEHRERMLSAVQAKRDIQEHVA
jgi:alkylation response protein AidB-like acyl-CoA dehydrogenase